jgi:cytochrome c oxidase subunit IV
MRQLPILTRIGIILFSTGIAGLLMTVAMHLAETGRIRTGILIAIWIVPISLLVWVHLVSLFQKVFLK